jgi:hypothetical protein
LATRVSGGLTAAAGRARREQVRLSAAEMLRERVGEKGVAE